MIRRKTPLPPRKEYLKRSRPKKTGTKEFYTQAIAISSWECENCREFILHDEKWRQYAAQAHILSKKQFPSVALVLLNRLLLCLRCHANWDASWESARKMPVFVLAVVRFIQFRHLIAKNEIQKLPIFFYEMLLPEEDKNDEEVLAV